MSDSPFAAWLRTEIENREMKIKHFADAINAPYATVMAWLHHPDPRPAGRYRVAIARVFQIERTTIDEMLAAPAA